MNQQEFNLTHPVSHSRDPDTSKAAERSITDSGKRKSNNEKIHWLVCMYPGHTASELAYKAKYHPGAYPFDNQVSSDKLLIEVRRRLSDMNGIHVRRGEKHEARIGLLKNKESIWFPK